MKPGEIHGVNGLPGYEFLVIADDGHCICYYSLGNNPRIFLDSETTDNEYFMSHPVLTSIFIGEL